MAVLTIPSNQTKVSNNQEIKSYLKERGVEFTSWSLKTKIPSEPEKILEAYQDEIKTLMTHKGYQTADVVNVTEDTPNIGAIRQKFLKEHTHTEDEVRFFVRGEGLFWFNCSGDVFSVLCQPGDLISVPANTPHWFDLGESPNVLAIRIFTDPEGWVAHYTDSGIDQNYNPTYQ